MMSLIGATTRFVAVQFLLKYRKLQQNNVLLRKNFQQKMPIHGFLNIPLLMGALFWKSQAQSSDPKKNAVCATLDHADQLFENGHIEECYQYLKNCQNNDVEIQWRLCRVMYNMAKETKYEKSYKRELISEAYHIISGILKDNYDNYAVHKWYALLLDAESTEIGLKERIKQLENVKKHMDLAVLYNPNDATTLYMLGEWCYQVSEMPWHQRKIAETFFASPPYSTYEEALEYFLKAESTRPRFYSLNLLRLGNCYLKLKKEDQAKYYLKLAASYPAKTNDDHQANKEAAELLKQLK
ncbi:regulator of microtubule dynamics protein 1-like isoform X1 [Cydia pomonella]|uniref:regulator of microtubule dynamics protein 1-like isoform X1 n=1 Tax=Cydia pomonella TaxID=82600 RepID=UPI002ADDC0BE|nr:regulator of microtubule dynamics protein 1-like isoform X1 [Cydia pomonella]